ncbi:hypothetical protein L3X38_022062 [Prunus dulcis]|uniref:Protein kinase domain-containing protein n=1 Tax=Prunus dulcis TaxID=3755 RepID=A0AAD4VVA8_PRUDU|nr:hypothetical protein L3X38_022062 [Prunus dulcis]
MEKFQLVLQYMPNGSLDKWLYSQNSHLNYLHRDQGYSKHVVHCDVKTSNILLDDDMVAQVPDFGIARLFDGGDPITQTMTLAKNYPNDDIVAHVADFGIARLLGGGDSMTQTMTLATIGYMAPEFGMEGVVSTRGDVYSFGVVLMETFTKRKPTYEMFVDMDCKFLVSRC